MLETILGAIEEGRIEPLYLVTGERVAGEPAGQRIAEAAARQVGFSVETIRHPAGLDAVLADLRTLSLFGAGKILLVVDSQLLTDEHGVAELIDEAGKAVPISPGDELTTDERRAAGRLLQALRLYKVDPYSGSAEEALARLPDRAYQGGATYRRKTSNRGRGRRQVEDLRSGLAGLLTRARDLELQGWAETDLAELGQLIDGGLPPNHTLVMVERSAAESHPLVAGLAQRGALVSLDSVKRNRRGEWKGLGDLVEELKRDTGVGIEREAVEALARRTLQQHDYRDGGGVRQDSTERFAGEYRKLASLADGGMIGTELVEKTVDDRGSENVWQILDAIGEGRAGEALHRIDRLLAASEDPVRERLSFFALLANFANDLTTIAGLARAAGVARGERDFNRFKSSLVPKLTAPTGSGTNPLARHHPFKLHRAYLAASRLPAPLLASLPAKVLRAELALKGGSRRPRTVLAAFVTELANPSV